MDDLQKEPEAEGLCGMEIKKVSIIGLGALGTMFGHHLANRIPGEDLRIIADRDRITRYRHDGIYCNGKRCDFSYLAPEDPCAPADLLLIAVKYNGLREAVAASAKHVGEQTVILSLLNGISSEEIIGQTYGMDKLLYCVAQGMDALKTGNQLTYQSMGMLCFGGALPGEIPEKAERVGRFFDRTAFPYQIDPYMKKRMWGKFMLNVGINQTVAVFEGDYGQVQREGPEREMMIAAMREVITLSQKEDVNLTESDLNYWLEVIKPLNPRGKPSMRQDLEGKRCSEVELFSGTVLELSAKHHLPCPVNQFLYEKIRAAERLF